MNKKKELTLKSLLNVTTYVTFCIYKFNNSSIET